MRENNGVKLVKARETGSYLQNNSKIKYVTYVDSPAFCEDDCSLVSIRREHDARENSSFQVVEDCACIFQNEFPLEGNFYRERGNFTSRGNEHFSHQVHLVSTQGPLNTIFK